jgi:hypothetical protein
MWDYLRKLASLRTNKLASLYDRAYIESREPF